MENKILASKMSNSLILAPFYPFLSKKNKALVSPLLLMASPLLLMASPLLLLPSPLFLPCCHYSSSHVGTTPPPRALFLEGKKW
jgi:hypothetical protein